MKTRYKLLVFLVMFVIFSVSQTFGYWRELTPIEGVGFFPNIYVGHFDFKQEEHPEPEEEDFPEEDLEVFEVEEDEDGDIVHTEPEDPRLNESIPTGTIIKTDIYYVAVKDIIMNHLTGKMPTKDNPLSWAVLPIQIDYLPGWQYPQNRVVRASNGKYYISRDGGNSTDPITANQTAWDMIESMSDSDFEKFEGTNVADYRKPIQSRILRPIIWSSTTVYTTNDIVVLLSDENTILNYYTAINGWALNQNPANIAWAWRVSTAQEIAAFKTKLENIGKLPDYMK